MTTNENKIDTDQVSIYHATPFTGAPGVAIARDRIQFSLQMVVSYPTVPEVGALSRIAG